MRSLDRYIEAHNAAARSGDWAPFAEWFACMLSRQIGVGRANGIPAKNGAK